MYTKSHMTELIPIKALQEIGFSRKMCLQGRNRCGKAGYLVDLPGSAEKGHGHAGCCGVAPQPKAFGLPVGNKIRDRAPQIPSRWCLVADAAIDFRDQRRVAEALPLLCGQRTVRGRQQWRTKSTPATAPQSSQQSVEVILLAGLNASPFQ